MNFFGTPSRHPPPRRRRHPRPGPATSPRPGEHKALSDPRSRPAKGSRSDRAAGRTVTLCIPCSVPSRHRLPPHRQGWSAAPLGTALIAAGAPPSRPAAGSAGRGTTTPTGSDSARHGAVARRLATRQPRAVTAATRPDRIGGSGLAGSPDVEPTGSGTVDARTSRAGACRAGTSAWQNTPPPTSRRIRNSPRDAHRPTVLASTPNNSATSTWGNSSGPLSGSGGSITGLARPAAGRGARRPPPDVPPGNRAG